MGKNGAGLRSVPDPIDTAIATSTGKELVNMTVMAGQFGDSGRPFQLSLPQDVTEAEAYALIELITKVRQQAHRAETAGPKVWTPGRG